YFAEAFFLPIVLAILLNLLLSPLIRALKRWGIPEPLGAALVVVALLGAAGGSIYGLAAPAKEWIAKLPGSVREAHNRSAKLRKPVEQASKTAEQLEQATNGKDPKAPEPAAKGP